MIIFAMLIALGGLTALLLIRKPNALVLGQHLTRMTNIFEEIEGTRYVGPIGTGGGIDSLSPARRRQATIEFDEGVAYLKGFPRHQITRELIKNAHLANAMGRSPRMIAIDRLLGVLIDMNVALGAKEFDASYS